MTTIEAKIVTDSISPARKRITTFVLRYPRYIHAELLTHRMLSRNSSSSRAIPVRRIIADIKEDPVVPLHFGLNEKGMQASQEVDLFTRDVCEKLWLDAGKEVLKVAETLQNMGIHKQVVNRILEPWSHISVVVTATEWDNFFFLRCSPEAQPEMRILAEKMYEAYIHSIPNRIEFGGWHLPFIKDSEKAAPGHYDKAGKLKNETNLVKASVARCARVSYLTHDKKEPKLDEDIALHDRLLSSRHMSPFEHIAQPLTDPHQRSGNFRGWLQYRQTIKNHTCWNFEPNKESNG